MFENKQVGNKTDVNKRILWVSESGPKRTESRQRHHGSASPALAQRRCSRGELHPINSNNPQRSTHHNPLLRDKDMAAKRRQLVTSARSPLLKPGERKEGSSMERNVTSWEAFLRKNSQQKSHLMVRWLLRGWWWWSLQQSAHHQPIWRMFYLASSYFLRGLPPKYRRRWCVSQPSSGWIGVGPHRHGHQDR